MAPVDPPATSAVPPSGIQLLSTSVCRLPAPPEQVLERWRELGGGALGLALDPRLPATARESLLESARASRLPCRELGHPVAAERGALPSPCSSDRDERRAARLALEQTLEVAHRHGVSRVILPPASLPLRPERAELAQSFARGEALGLEQIEESREEGVAAALDALCLVLEPCLRIAEGLGLRVALLWPSPWPHGFPGAAELGVLLGVFDGAPLAGCLCLDWVALHGTLRGGRDSAPEEAEQPAALESLASLTAGCPTLLASQRLACIRVADACGLSQRLPLGTGEAGWRSLLAELGARARSADQVLTFRPDTRAEEVARALALLASAAEPGSDR